MVHNYSFLENQLRAFIEEDIYWEKGIWIKYDIYPWVQAF